MFTRARYGAATDWRERCGDIVIFIVLLVRWWPVTDNVLPPIYVSVHVQYVPKHRPCSPPGVNHSTCIISSPLPPWDKHEEFAPQIFPGHEVSRRVVRLIRWSRKSNTLAVYQPSCRDAIVCAASEFSVVTVTARTSSLPLTPLPHLRVCTSDVCAKNVHVCVFKLFYFLVHQEKRRITCDTDKLFLVVSAKKKTDIHCCGCTKNKEKKRDSFEIITTRNTH